MFRKTLIMLFAFALVGVCVFGAASVAEPSVGLPEAITAESACPATGCASGTCHGYEAIPEPDGMHAMICPEAGCASVECHAWDALGNRYRQANDASLNLWVLLPVLVIAGLVALVRKGGRA